MHQLSHRNWFALAMGMTLACLCASPLWAGNVYYVSPTGTAEGDGSFIRPYDLATGLAKSDSSEIRFLPGTYFLEADFVTRNNVVYAGWTDDDTPAGEEGRGDVVIDGQAAHICLSANQTGGWTMRGMTLRNGSDVHGGLAKLANVRANCVVSNCVFRETVSRTGCALTTSVLKADTDAPIVFADCDFCELECYGSWSGDSSSGVMKPYNTEFRHCNIYNNKQEYNAYSCLGYGSADFYDCVISNNTGTGSGGFRATKSTWVRCRFDGNTFGTSSGCISFINTGSCVVDSCYFTNNVSASGSCIGSDNFSSSNTRLLVTNSVFVGNSSTKSGGAIFIDKKGWTNEIVCCFFTNNVSGKSSGAIHLESQQLDDMTTVRGCDFYGNVAAEWGGAISAGWSLGITIEDSTFTTNRAANSGAFHHYTGTSGQLKNPHVVNRCTFRNNIATGHYSVMDLAGAVSNCTFVGNRSLTTSSSVGPIYLVAHNSVNTDRYWTNRVAGCFLADNNLQGVTCGGDDLVMTDTVISNNDGRAVNLNLAKRFLIDRCQFIDNHVSSQNGAAIQQTWAGSNNALDGRIRNCLFLRNANLGKYGGGSASVVALNANTYVDNCTFVSNNCPTGLYGAMDMAGATDVPRIVNCLFFGNYGTYKYNSGNNWRKEGQIRVYADDNRYWNCMVELEIPNLSAEKGNVMGTTTVPVDPMFTDPEHDDYTLAKGSPCIDAGLDAPWMAGARDIRNKRKFPRIVGDAVDIGCYEYRPTPGLLLEVK